MAQTNKFGANTHLDIINMYVHTYFDRWGDSTVIIRWQLFVVSRIALREVFLCVETN